MVAGLKNNTHQHRVKRLQTWSYFLLCGLSSPDPLSLRSCVINSSESIESGGEHPHLIWVTSQRSCLRPVALCYLSLTSLDLGLFTKIAFAANSSASCEVTFDVRRLIWVISQGSWLLPSPMLHLRLPSTRDVSFESFCSDSVRHQDQCVVLGRRRLRTLHLSRFAVPSFAAKLSASF